MKNPDILYEDDSLLVVDKPVGVVVNRSSTTTKATLQDFLLEKYPLIFEEFSQKTEFVDRAGIVHRLDKDTSGVLIVAKTPEVLGDLQRQFKERIIWKKYIALVIGEPKEEVIEIAAPLGRNPKNRLRFAVVEGGRKAITRVEKEESRGDLTLVYVYPKTGRTHQIRVHLAALGNPIVGDVLYCTKKQLQMWGDVYDRMMLHACEIRFTHPVTGDILTVKAPIPNKFFDTI